MTAKDKAAKITVTDDTSEAETVEVTQTPEPGTAPEMTDTADQPIAPEADDKLDAETEQAVDDIAAQESDELLAIEDQKAATAAKPKKPGRWRRFIAWWKNPLKRRLTIGTMLVVLIAMFVIPASRYFVLNTAGVRSSASLTVLDDSTQQPLRNVEVTLGDQTASTNKAGQVVFKQLQLGKAELKIQKRAFASIERQVTIGWGSNPLDQVALKPEGSQYRFVITDYLSGKSLAGIEATSDEATALSNEAGEITLTLESIKDIATADVTIAAEGYRTEDILLDLDSQEVIQVQLVPVRPHVFISKRSGRYDVYRIDADGKNEAQVLAGSGVERDDLVLVAHPTKQYAALVSTRENVRRDGFLLSTLTLINTDENLPAKIAQSERVQIVDWVGDRLVYVQIAAGASGDDPKRHRLMSYDLSTGQTTELAAANYFNDVLAVRGYIYYAPSGAYSGGEVKFHRVRGDGGDRQTVLDQEVWSVYRTGYDKLVLAIGQSWYDFQISANKTSQLPGEPGSLASRIYINSPDASRSLWVDQRDGKGVLLAYDLESKQDTVLHEQSGLGNPLQWLGDSAVVFRVTTSDETADYVISINGGEPKKLRDVTNTSGIERWYYY